jgi:hypothetical protein
MDSQNYYESDNENKILDLTSHEDEGGGENVQYIYTNSKYKNPLCRVVPVLKYVKDEEVRLYDKEKYLDLLLDAPETVLGYFGFDANVYRKSENGRNTINRNAFRRL